VPTSKQGLRTNFNFLRQPVSTIGWKERTLFIVRSRGAYIKLSRILKRYEGGEEGRRGEEEGRGPLDRMEGMDSERERSIHKVEGKEADYHQANLF
jgi:hypothetical protein